ncbi:MAG: hypothetical protein IJJ47_09695 [Methanosphaera sp.]|nr:hypothetical protein [Methanosphaera sp.]
MVEQISIKKFEDYQQKMPMSDILTFAKIGFTCSQILKKEGLLKQFKEAIQCIELQE